MNNSVTKLMGFTWLGGTSAAHRSRGPGTGGGAEQPACDWERQIKTKTLLD